MLDRLLLLLLLRLSKCILDPRFLLPEFFKFVEDCGGVSGADFGGFGAG